MNRVDVIAIDGPGGSGKGTAAAGVAERFGWRLLDSGALYRVVALVAGRRGVDFTDDRRLAALADGLGIAFTANAVLVNGRDEAENIRAPHIADAASRVAASPAVRRALLAAQHGFRRPPGLVADGRDMGTVVFPDARLKVFLTASAMERAKRRYRQLKDREPNVKLSGLFEAIRERDERDRTRAVSPLVAAPDAVTIDSTRMSIAEVTDAILDLAQRKGLAPSGSPRDTDGKRNVRTG